MKYTFEITIAGCSTNCAHCYVNGGIGKSMSYDDYYLCLSKLIPVFDKLNDEISITLGNEIFCNRDIKKIIDYSTENIPRYFSYHDFSVPTTGIALLHLRDRDNILNSLKSARADSFMLALHGNKFNHNLIVQNPDGFDEICKTADFLIGNRFNIVFNQIISKLMVNDFPEIIKRISSICY